MGRSNDYQEKYKKAKSLYQQGEYSITQIAKILQMDRKYTKYKELYDCRGV